MTVQNPHHGILLSLLDRKQFEPCRTAVEDMILAQLEAESPDDRDLAYLHLFLCRALQGEHQYELAGAKADIAAFLARKLKDRELAGEALFRAGYSCIQAGNYRGAIDRFTACLGYGSEVFQAKALFNRGHAYERQQAFSFAVQDFDAAIRLAGEQDPPLVRLCRLNLAWDLIMLRDFARAERVLEQLSSEAGADTDRRLQLQMAHDRLHISYLKGNGRQALLDSLLALRTAGIEYPHVKARIALTLMSISVERGLAEQGFTMGVLAKQHAGRADRLDIEEEAGRQIQALEFLEGTDCLAQSLLRMGQVTLGSLKPKRSSKRGHQIGGVG